MCLQFWSIKENVRTYPKCVRLYTGLYSMPRSKCLKPGYLALADTDPNPDHPIKLTLLLAADSDVTLEWIIHANLYI